MNPQEPQYREHAHDCPKSSANTRLTKLESCREALIFLLGTLTYNILAFLIPHSRTSIFPFNGLLILNQVLIGFLSKAHPSGCKFIQYTATYAYIALKWVYPNKFVPDFSADFLLAMLVSMTSGS